MFTKSGHFIILHSAKIKLVIIIKFEININSILWGDKSMKKIITFITVYIFAFA